LGFLRVTRMDSAPLGSIETAQELWANFWLYFAGYRNELLRTPAKPLISTSAAVAEIMEMRQELMHWGCGLGEAAQILSAALEGDALELLDTTKKILSQLERVSKAVKSPHLLPFRVMLNHMQEHLFDPDPKKSVEMLAALFRDYGDGMRWAAGRDV